VQYVTIKDLVSGVGDKTVGKVSELHVNRSKFPLEFTSWKQKRLSQQLLHSVETKTGQEREREEK
jgi:hypothetical protein